jgi:predicted MPP superfamily phosphohydrolase
MESLMDKELLNLCYKKYNKEINLTWTEIAKPYDITGEALRSKFKKYRKTNGELKSKEIVRDVAIEKKISEIEMKEINLKKERIKLQDLRTSINKDIRILARKETLADLIKESIKYLPPINFKQPEHLHSEDNEMVVQISDPHFGLTVDNEFEKYNEDVFLERLANYTLQILDIKKKEKINKCHLCFSGDALSGIIHETIIRNNQYGIVEQTKKFSEYMSKFIEKLSNHFEDIVVHFVTGNHSRNNEFKEKTENKDRYENFVLEFMELRTANLINVKFEKSILDNTIAEFYIKGHYCCLYHGDYGNTKTAPSQLLALLDKKPKMIFLGHKHIFEILTVDKCKVITSGVWVTHDEYCVNHRYSGETSQTITIVGDRGFVCAYDCNLK